MSKPTHFVYGVDVAHDTPWYHICLHNVPAESTVYIVLKVLLGDKLLQTRSWPWKLEESHGKLQALQEMAIAEGKKSVEEYRLVMEL